MIEYAYDNLSRLTEARYNPGTNVDAADGDLLRRYEYEFDRAGNRTQQIVSVAGTPTTTNYDYNAANQLIDDGTYTYEYDANGNLRYKKLTGTPVEEYIWNRANRLVTWDNGTPADLLNYSYDGLNNRISRALGTSSPVVTQYLLDLQPGLSVVLAATEDTDVTRYVHGPRGIHAQEDPAGAWSWFTQDGLGSVRGVLDNSVAVDEVRLNDPFGNQVTGAPYDYAATVYGFTGEVTETVNPLVHLRARDYNPALGVFTALDPFEGMWDDPMSINSYAYVHGNPVNFTDPSGEVIERVDVDNGRIVYSCSCGWIDWDHANPIHALNLIRTVGYAYDPQSYSSTSSCGMSFQTTMDTWTGIQMQSGSSELYGRPLLGNYLPWYYIPRNHTGTVLGTSARIYRDLVRTFEANEESAWNPFARDSAYSVEDLPSYLIGFVLASRMEYYGYADEFYAAADKQTTLRTTVASRFLSDCNILDSQMSLMIYDELEYDLGVLRADRYSNQPKNHGFYPIFADPNLSPTVRSACAGTSRNDLLFYAATTGDEETDPIIRPENADCNLMVQTTHYPNTIDGPIPLYECQAC